MDFGRCAFLLWLETVLLRAITFLAFGLMDAVLVKAQLDSQLIEEGTIIIGIGCMAALLGICGLINLEPIPTRCD